MILLFIPFATVLYWMYNQQKAAEMRIAVLEQLVRMQKPSSVKEYKKPEVQGAKEVEPLQIGRGRLNFDEENQIAEWV